MKLIIQTMMSTVGESENQNASSASECCESLWESSEPKVPELHAARNKFNEYHGTNGAEESGSDRKVDDTFREDHQGEAQNHEDDRENHEDDGENGEDDDQTDKDVIISAILEHIQHEAVEKAVEEAVQQERERSQLEFQNHFQNQFQNHARARSELVAKLFDEGKLVFSNSITSQPKAILDSMSPGPLGPLGPLGGPLPLHERLSVGKKAGFVMWKGVFLQYQDLHRESHTESRKESNNRKKNRAKNSRKKNSALLGKFLGKFVQSPEDVFSAGGGGALILNTTSDTAATRKKTICFSSWKQSFVICLGEKYKQAEHESKCTEYQVL